MFSEKSAIAANRFGLGARPGDAMEIGHDAAGWLRAQLEDAAATVPKPARRPASAATLEEVTELRIARQQLQRLRAQSDQPLEIDRDMLREYAQFIGSQYRVQASQRCIDAIESDRPFVERLVHFWANHFAVSVEKQPLGAIAVQYEDEAIRPHVAGNFFELLKAVEQHPAMLLYLDNQRSIGPNSLAARAAQRRRGRSLGLNENLAREILELHTLGVDGGYDQNDVTEFARMLTGWSIGGTDGPLAGGEPGEFVFRGLMHEPGDKTLLGRRYRESGIDEGEAALRMLATQPATARHLATKLARHFVADVPPPALVERLADVYLRADGELMPVYAALIEADESWQTPLAKYKTPEDLVISTYRALDRIPDRPQQLIAILTQLGQRPLTPGSPAGWPDNAAHWDGGEALLKRIEWVGAVGRNVGDRIDPAELGQAILGPVASDATLTAVRRAESGAQGIGLLLASPEFQRR